MRGCDYFIISKNDYNFLMPLSELPTLIGVKVFDHSLDEKSYLAVRKNSRGVSVFILGYSLALGSSLTLIVRNITYHVSNRFQHKCGLAKCKRSWIELRNLKEESKNF
jgi:hypothetical protein